MEDTVKISNVLVSEIVPDPQVPNPRGPIFDTTSLQPSIRTDGIKRPLWVRLAANGSTGYWLIDGYRRWTAARAVELETAPVEIHDVDDRGVRKLQLLANQQEDLPFIVMDKNDEINGGTCTIVCHEIEENGAKRQELAPYLGVTPDTVGALYRLCFESAGLQRLVADDRMAITVYSKVKMAPPKLKAYIVSQVAAQKLRGNITARYVNELLAKWDDIKGGLSENDPEDDEPDDQEAPAESEKIQPEEPKPASHYLGVALGAIKKIDGEIEPYEMHLVRALLERLEMFNV